MHWIWSQTYWLSKKLQSGNWNLRLLLESPWWWCWCKMFATYVSCLILSYCRYNKVLNCMLVFNNNYVHTYTVASWVMHTQHMVCWNNYFQKKNFTCFSVSSCIDEEEGYLLFRNNFADFLLNAQKIHQIWYSKTVRYVLDGSNLLCIQIVLFCLFKQFRLQDALKSDFLV